MRLTRVFVDATLEAGARVTLEGSAAGHLTRVLRLRKGDSLIIFNGRGGEYAAVIDATRGSGVTVAVGEHDTVERESPLAVTVAQGISRGERMDLVVQKATELGVHIIVPLLTERTVVRLDERQAARKMQHWRAVAIGACEQCGRNRVPQVSAPRPLRQFIREGSLDPPAARLLLSPAARLRLDDLPRRLSAITVLIGPEGGLTDEEEQAAVSTGYTAVRLGPRVLRTETAALVALALLQQQFGDLDQAT
jgi:16S rRNA (uracil1498-N3)-methyltransferase